MRAYYEKVPHREPITADRMARAWEGLIRALPKGQTTKQIAAAIGLSHGQVLALSCGRCGRPTVEAVEKWIRTPQHYQVASLPCGTPVYADRKLELMDGPAETTNTGRRCI